MARKLLANERIALRITRNAQTGQRIMSVTKSGGLMNYDLEDEGIRLYRDNYTASIAAAHYYDLLNSSPSLYHYTVEKVDIKEAEPHRYLT